MEEHVKEILEAFTSRLDEMKAGSSQDMIAEQDRLAGEIKAVQNEVKIGKAMKSAQEDINIIVKYLYMKDKSIYIKCLCLNFYLNLQTVFFTYFIFLFNFCLLDCIILLSLHLILMLEGNHNDWKCFKSDKSYYCIFFNCTFSIFKIF